MATTGNECSNCLKYRDGWCRYKGIIDPAAIKPDRRSRLCKPVPKKERKGIDYGSIATGELQALVFGRKYDKKKQS